MAQARSEERSKLPGQRAPPGGIDEIAGPPAARAQAALRRQAEAVRGERDVFADEGSRLNSAPGLHLPQSIGVNCAKPRRAMRTASHLETLTKRKVLIQERTQRFISELRRLVQLLDADINIEEERTGTFDLTNPDYSIAARQLRTRRENLTDTISRLEGTLSARVPSAPRKMPATSTT